MSTADETPRYQVGDSIVIVDWNTESRPQHTREFFYRVKRLGTVTVYRMDLPQSEVDHLSHQALAEYLLLKVRRKSKLFSYREP